MKPIAYTFLPEADDR